MPTRQLVADAVEDGTDRIRQPLWDRLFTLAFRGFVYPQIWEDPEVDLAALEPEPHHRMVTIASGGCNVLNYLSRVPCEVTALDLNPAHIALTRLKLAAVRHLPDQEAFFRFFGHADERANLRLYRDHLRPHLDAETRAYWDARDRIGRRRIDLFARNIYRFGLLGRFVGALHTLARLHGQDPRRVLAAEDPDERRAVFAEVTAPVFRSALVRGLCRLPASLYGLGIPPAQYRVLATSAGGDMPGLLRARLEHLACDFPVRDNYFAWQAFGRGYDRERREAVPPYLRPEAFPRLREAVDRATTRQTGYTDFLAGQPAASLDRYVLLDAQDWMSPRQLTELWTEIERTAAPGARVIFRTAGPESVLEDGLPPELRAGWHYDRERSREFTAADRSAIYGGFHLYRKAA